MREISLLIDLRYPSRNSEQRDCSTDVAALFRSYLGKSLLNFANFIVYVCDALTPQTTVNPFLLQSCTQAHGRVFPSKFALERICPSLGCEVLRNDIDVTEVVPVSYLSFKRDETSI